VCTYTQDKHNDNIVSGVLGEGGSKAPHQLRGLGSAVSSPSGVRGAAPASNRFFAFWCAQNGSPTQHEAPEHAWAPPPPDRGVWGSFLRLGLHFDTDTMQVCRACDKTNTFTFSFHHIWGLRAGSDCIARVGSTTAKCKALLYPSVHDKMQCVQNNLATFAHQKATAEAFLGSRSRIVSLTNWNSFTTKLSYLSTSVITSYQGCKFGQHGVINYYYYYIP